MENKEQKKPNCFKKKTPKTKEIPISQVITKNKKDSKIEQRLKTIEKALFTTMEQMTNMREEIATIKSGIMQQTWSLLYNNAKKKYGLHVYKETEEQDLVNIFGIPKPITKQI